MRRLWGFPQLGVKPPRLFLGAMSRIVMGFRWRPHECARVFCGPAGV